MKTININLYSFDELTDEAKLAAIDDYREKYMSYYPWEDYDNNTIKTICRILNVEPFYINTFHSFNTNAIDEDILELTNNRALAYIMNNYISPYFKGKYISKTMNKSRYSKVFSEFRLTGYDLDYTMIDALKAFKEDLKKGYTLTIKDYINFVGTAIEKSLEDDYSYWLSDESVKENIKINLNNACVFLENGKIYKEV